MDERLEDQVRETLTQIQKARESMDEAKARRDAAASDENHHRVEMDNLVIKLARLLQGTPNLLKELKYAEEVAAQGRRS